MACDITVNSEIFARTKIFTINKVLANKVTISFIDSTSLCSQVQELANKSEIENSRNNSHAKNFQTYSIVT